jgi:DNA polymerase
MSGLLDLDPVDRSLSSITALAAKAAACRRCPLHEVATQTVFGEGPQDATMVLVGEQPGDQEDLAKHPFVGPAGKLLDRALVAAGIDRSKVYLTNAVKHFKNEARGKRRLHKRPNPYEISRCRRWLEGELAIIKPNVVVGLGAPAASALAGHAVVISRDRGKSTDFSNGLPGFVTTHPLAILRMRGEVEHRATMDMLVRDFKTARRTAEKSPVASK